MSEARRPWGTALVFLALYRRARRRLDGKRGNPTRRLLVRLWITMVALLLLGPVLWRALWTMPPGLAVVIGSAMTIRLVRWYLRRGR